MIYVDVSAMVMHRSVRHNDPSESCRAETSVRVNQEIGVRLVCQGSEQGGLVTGAFIAALALVELKSDPKSR